MDTIISVLTDKVFLGVFFEAIVLILAGYFFVKKKILTKEDKHALTTVIWKIAVPCLAFDAFMTDFNKSDIISEIGILILTSVIYLLVYFIGKLAFRNHGKQESSICGILGSVGQLTIFSMPIIMSVYEKTDSSAMISVSIMTIPFRIMVYMIAFFIISGTQTDGKNLSEAIKKICLSPIIIAMFSGMLIWITQGILPQVNINGESVGFLRVDKTLPVIYKTVKSVKTLVFPLSMLVIGMSLGASNAKSAISDKLAWKVSIVKTLITPLVTAALITVLQLTGIMSFTETQITVMLIGFAAPASATVVMYCIQYEACEDLASRICFISTLLCIATVPAVYVDAKLLAIVYN